MSQVIPLKFNYGDSSPSGIGEILTSDVMAVSSIVTSTLSVDSFSTESLSSTTVKASTVSGTIVKGIEVSGTTVSGSTVRGLTSVSGLVVEGVTLSGIDTKGTTVSGTTVKGITVSGGSVYGTTVSATTNKGVAYAGETAIFTTSLKVSGCPYPAPFGYVQTDTAGNNSTDEHNFASGADTTNIVSDSDHLTWKDSEKQFHVSAAGTYELIANLVVDSGSQSDPIEIRSKRNGSTVLTISPKLYGNVGPVERTFHNILTAEAGDTLTVTVHMDDGGTKTAHIEVGSTLTIKRVL